MRTRLIIPVLLAAAGSTPVAAQVVTRTMPDHGAYSFSWTGDQSPGAVIGVTTSADARDTLGLLVTDVTTGSPADKAGVEAGDRIQAINGVDLKLESIDVGDRQMADAMSRRLTRELAKLKPGDNVSLKIYHNGQLRTADVKTVDSDALYGSAMGMMNRPESNRAMLGVSLAVTGSKRDTLGILVIGVDDSGPAAQAGLEEGNRIAEINGVNLKVDRADAGDSYVANARYQRLQKEMVKVKPGDDVTLQVYDDGHFKTVRVKAAKASDLGMSGQNLFIMRNGEGAPMLQFDLDRQRVNAQVKRAMDQARIDTQQVSEQVRRAMNRVRQELQQVRIETTAPRVRWLDDDDAPEAMPLAPMAVPAPPSPAVAPTPMPAVAAVRALRAAPMLRPAIAPVPASRIIWF
jgi:serine protease Do